MSASVCRCPICHLRHRPPKASRALFGLAQCVAFTAVEVPAALHLSGWLSVALWLVVARNELWFVAVVYGLALLAVEKEVR